MLGYRLRRMKLGIRRALGIISVAVGIFLVLQVAPFWIWWVFLGIGLVLVGWALFRW